MVLWKPVVIGEYSIPGEPKAKLEAWRSQLRDLKLKEIYREKMMILTDFLVPIRR